jgi:hypothetical protein
MIVNRDSNPHCRARDGRSVGLRSARWFEADQPDHHRRAVVVVEVALVSVMGEEEPWVLEVS